MIEQGNNLHSHNVTVYHSSSVRLGLLFSLSSV